MPNVIAPSARTVMGFLMFAVGVAFAVWMKHDGTLTWQALGLCFVVSGGGAYFIEPTLLRGYVHEVREVAPGVFRTPAGATVVDRAPAAPPVVVPAAGPPAEVRAGDAPERAPAIVAAREESPPSAPVVSDAHAMRAYLHPSPAVLRADD